MSQALCVLHSCESPRPPCLRNHNPPPALDTKFQCVSTAVVCIIQNVYLLLNQLVQALTAAQAPSSVTAVGILIIAVIYQSHCSSSVVH